MRLREDAISLCLPFPSPKVPPIPKNEKGSEGKEINEEEMKEMIKPKKKEEDEVFASPRQRKEEDEKEDMEDKKLEGIAVLPTEPSCTISTIPVSPINANMKVTVVSTMALPSLTLSVAPSSLKQSHPPTTVKQCLPEPSTSTQGVPKGATAKKQAPAPSQVSSTPSQAPILPAFSKTLEPKYVVGASTGLFSKEKDWRRNLFGGPVKGKQKDTSSSSAIKGKSTDRGTDSLEHVFCIFTSHVHL